MRIIDQDGIEVENPDLELGHLELEHLFIAHHEEVSEKPRIEEEGEPIWQNPDDPENALIPIVVVQEYAPAVPAWEEYEDVQRYVLYTEQELAEKAEQKATEEAARVAAEEAADIAKALEKKRNFIVDAAPARFDAVEGTQLDHDEAIVALHESQAQSQLDVDEALVTLYELATGGAV